MLKIKEWSLKRKIILHVVVIGTITAFILTFLYISTQRNIIHSMNRERAELASSMIESSIKPAMEEGKPDSTQSIFQEIASSNSLKWIRILSPEGKILKSSEKEEIGRFVDGATLSRIDDLLSKKDISGTFFNKPKSTLQRFKIIENQEKCMGCHPSSEKINGILDVNIDYANTVSFLRKNQFKGVIIALTSLAILVYIILRLFEKLINRPISQLKDRMEKVQEGNLNIQIPVKKKDEIGSLTKSFNLMVKKLNEANQRIEELFNKQMEKAEHLASIGELAAGLAHEIKNPIAGMKGALEIINQKTNPSDPKKEIFTEILLQIEKISQIIQDLLTFAKPKEMSMSIVNPNESIKNAIKLAKTQMNDKDVRFRFKGLENGTLAMIDADKIQEVMLNLILNSISAIREKGQIRIKLLKEGKNYLEILFSDNGTGIKKEHLPQIFNPFFTTKRRGTGLGLSICKKIISAHKGTIEVESKESKGTTFTIRLPVLMCSD